MSSWRSPPTPTERLAVARILGAKGLAGLVKIEVLTDWPEHLQSGSELYLEDEPDPRRVLRLESGGRMPALLLEGIETREAAEALVGRYIESEAAELPAGAYYWHQLEGLAVVDEDGHPVGTLVEVFRAGENEVYRIEGERGEVLLPALRDVVLGIDLAGRRMVVRYEFEEVR